MSNSDSTSAITGCHSPLPGGADQRMEGRWYIQLFGTLQARRGERTLTRFRTRKTAALFAYLAFHADRVHSRDTLAELFWPDNELDRGRHNLRLALSSLRQE